MSFSMKEVTTLRQRRRATYANLFATVQGDIRYTDNVRESLILYIKYMYDTITGNRKGFVDKTLSDINKLLSYCCDKQAVLISRSDIERYETVIINYIKKSIQMGGISNMLESANSEVEFDFNTYLYELSKLQQSNKVERDRKPITTEDLTNFLFEVGVK